MDYNIVSDVAKELIRMYDLCKNDTCAIATGIVVASTITGSLICTIPEYFQTRKANKVLKQDNRLERSLK